MAAFFAPEGLQVQGTRIQHPSSSLSHVARGLRSCDDRSLWAKNLRCPSISQEGRWGVLAGLHPLSTSSKSKHAPPPSETDTERHPKRSIALAIWPDSRGRSGQRIGKRRVHWPSLCWAQRTPRRLCCRSTLTCEAWRSLIPKHEPGSPLARHTYTGAAYLQFKPHILGLAELSELLVQWRGVPGLPRYLTRVARYQTLRLTGYVESVPRVLHGRLLGDSAVGNDTCPPSHPSRKRLLSMGHHPRHGRTGRVTGGYLTQAPPY